MKEKQGSYQFIDHDADVGLSVQAESREEFFRTAARGLMDWIGPPPGGILEVKRNVEVKAEDLESLLVRWLQELIFLFHSEHYYVLQVPSLVAEHNRILATLQGRRWEESAREEFREVKAVTYHRLRVVRDGGVWKATVILDV